VNEPSQQLVKAQLFSLDDQKYDIHFMFNPTQLDFTRSIRLNQPTSARTTKGQPKISFAAPEPCVLNLTKVIFDTYEDSLVSGTKSVIDYIRPLIQATKFINAETPDPNNPFASPPPASRLPRSASQQAENNRPPLFLLIWGSQYYMRCFVESFKYQLTLFLPDGTPVRAVATLTLKEVDNSANIRTNRTPQREGNTRWEAWQ
jgi:hypothetical protein